MDFVFNVIFICQWNITHRHEFETAAFKVLFAQCETCAPHLTLELNPTEAQAQFGRDEIIRQGPNPDVSSYAPLYFRSRVVQVLRVLNFEF